MNDYLYLLLVRLIDKYGSLKKAIDILAQMYPANKRIKQIGNGLDKGQLIEQLLDRNSFERQISFYCQYLPLSKAINVTSKNKNKKDKLLKQLTSKLSYQILLLICAVAILFLFTNLVMPTMIESLDINNTKTNTLVKSFDIICVVADILMVVFLTMMSIISYIFIFKRINYAWMLLHKYHFDNFLKIMGTYLFAGELEILLESGLSLDRCLDVIRLDKKHDLSNLIAHQLYENLTNGQQFEECLDSELLDKQFSNICLYDMQDSDFVQALSNYQEIIEMKIDILIRNSAFIIQSFCYGFVAIVIVLAYQVLMLPLEILQEV